MFAEGVVALELRRAEVLMSPGVWTWRLSEPELQMALGVPTVSPKSFRIQVEDKNRTL